MKQFMMLAMTTVLFTPGCEKNSAAKPNDSSEVVRAMDNSQNAKFAASSSTADIPGVDLTKLTKRGKTLFHKLANTLPSPCGKAHSLRVSVTKDASCKRSRFAARYVVQYLQDGFEEDDIREAYDEHYGKKKPVSFDLKGVPFVGPSDAQVVLVEFYDYGCPACKAFKSVLEQVKQEFKNDVAIYYKQFPLSAHPNSPGAARAAVAAFQQGKFGAMHDKLFANHKAHTDADLQRYAKEIGLNMTAFNTAFRSAKARVDADLKDGEKAGVMGTPTLYVNGRTYGGPNSATYLKMWIEEELAVNR